MESATTYRLAGSSVHSVKQRCYLPATTRCVCTQQSAVLPFTREWHLQTSVWLHTFLGLSEGPCERYCADKPGYNGSHTAWVLNELPAC